MTARVAEVIVSDDEPRVVRIYTRGGVLLVAIHEENDGGARWRSLQGKATVNRARFEPLRAFVGSPEEEYL